MQTSGEDETLSANAVDSSGGDKDVRCIKKVMQVCISKIGGKDTMTYGKCDDPVVTVIAILKTRM